MKLNPRTRIKSPGFAGFLVGVLALGLFVFGNAEPLGWLGVYHYALDPAMQVALGLDHGVMVKEVVGGSPAGTAGLKLGDIILQVDSEDILTAEDLSNYVGNRPEQNVRLTFVRQGKTDTVNVKLGTRERQLQLAADNLSPTKELAPQTSQTVRNVIDTYLDEMRALRQQMDELEKEIKQLRKDLKKSEKK